MADIIHWPICLLTPGQTEANVVAFSRTGGRSLGGSEPAMRTDLGYWVVDYSGVVMRNRNDAQWRTWQAIRTKLGGRSGLVAVPVPSSLSTPYASGKFEASIGSQHGDGSIFTDGSEYQQGAVVVVSEGITTIGSATIRLRIVNAAEDMTGVRFSFNHALYETGPVISIDGDVWTVPVAPTIREVIPSGSTLEFDRPTCLCHLADDRQMNVTQDALVKGARPNVSFIEATDYWNQLALGLI